MRLDLLKKAATSLAVTVGGVGAAFALDVVMARWMSPYEFGVARSCMSLIMILSSLLALGSGQAIIRSYARGAERADASADVTAMEYRLAAVALCLIGLGGALLFARWFAPSAQAFAPIAIAIVLSGVRAVYIVDRAALIAAARVWTAQITDRIFMFPLAIALLAAASPFVKVDAASSLVAYGIGLLASSVLARHFARDMHDAQPKLTGRWVARERARVAAVSMPYMMEDLVGMALRHAPVLALGAFGHLREAGVYAIAARVADLVLLAQASGNIAAAPMLARAHEAGDRRTLIVTSGVVSAFYILSALGLCGLLLVGGRVLTMVFGADYAGALPVSLWIILARALAASFGVSGQLLLMSGHAKQNAVVSSVAAIAMLVVLAAVIPTHPMLGATAGTIVGILVLGLGAWWTCLKKTGVNLLVPHPETVRELVRPRG
jgi:O-antigen/teichoic acid export membrane protein